MAVVLHIGLAKTGTSFLQRWLDLNRGVLESADMGVLRAPAAHRLGVSGITAANVKARADVVAIQASCSLEQAIDELRKAASQFSSIIVSSEYFSICSPIQVFAVLSEENIQVDTIICYLRRQDILCAAGYAQEVKSLGRSSKPPATAAYTSDLDWNLLRSRWREAFPNSTFILKNYDSLRAKNLLLDDFKKIIYSQPLATADQIERENPGLSAEMTEIARIFNANGIPFDISELFTVQTRFSHAAFSFSRETTKIFESLFLESNQRLAVEFPGTFDDFATPGWEPGGVDMTDRLTEERLAAILSEIGSVAPELLKV